jgi:hypothetical protein
MVSRSRTIRHLATVAVFSLAVGFGVDLALGSDNSPTAFLLSLALAVSGTTWCGADATVRGLNLVWPARIGIFLFGGFGVLAYIVWSRWPWGLLTALAVSFAWLFIMYIAYFVVKVSVDGFAYP